MEENLYATLNELCEISAPSTRENPVQRWLDTYLQKRGFQAQGDSQGNLWCSDHSDGQIKCGIVAHADEIGIQLISVEEPGIGRFRKIGGLRATSLIGQYVVFTNDHGEKAVGIIGCDPMQDNGTETGILTKISDLWVDIGAESVDEFRERVAIGDFATFRPYPVEHLSENRIVGKAFDDRCGLAAALVSFCHAAGTFGNIETTLVSTVQEELNLFGSKSLPIDLDVAIVVDVDFAADTPSSIAQYTDISLGKGIGICINADNNPILLKLLKDACREQNIPVQTTVGRSFSGGTDSAALRLKNATATVNISIPIRYMHSSVEMLDLRDLNHAVNAVIALMDKINQLKSIEKIVPWKE